MVYVSADAATLTFTILPIEVVLLAASVTVYVTVYVPGVEVFTGLVVTIELVRFPLTSSVAVAPASL
jgi:hypothetical protein